MPRIVVYDNSKKSGFGRPLMQAKHVMQGNRQDDLGFEDGSSTSKNAFNQLALSYWTKPICKVDGTGVFGLGRQNNDSSVGSQHRWATYNVASAGPPDSYLVVVVGVGATSK